MFSLRRPGVRARRKIALLEIDYDAVLSKILARGGDFADLYVEQGEPFSILCEEDRIEKVVSGRDWGVGVRLVTGGKTAYAYTNDLTTASLNELAEAVGRAAAASKDPSCVPMLNLTRKRPSADLPVLRPPRATDTASKVALVMGANATARAVDRRIRQVMVVYRENLQGVTIAGSDGFIAGDERTYVTAFVQVIAAEGGVVQTAYEPVGGFCGMELFDASSLEAAAQRAAQRAVLMLGARRAPAGKMAVVLSSEAGGTMIHEAVGHGLEADLAQSGLSIYSGKLGAQIASSLITVIDDATLPGKRGSFRFDDEGTAAQRTVLVEKGILRSFLYDRLTAMKDGARSTGNGRRESYRHRPIPRMSNTYIAPGDTDPGDILRDTPCGLYVRKMGGGQVNTVNGDFVFEVSEGYLIENGSIGEPVRGATLTGNGPRVLMSIDKVGSDLGFAIGTCGKDGQGAPVSDAQPTLRIPDIVVGGEVRQ
ncbi:MAG: peptidase C69 [Nitrospirae bacterium GWC2_57_13]|jgi:TldD protein|nr:MAG: peptidase C69 [Nitrospirae bacterium GWC2_57_13]HAS55620.1 peptidase C69 [Nitrospiraceae bacterium]